ncbi:hypothetical protein DB32_006657 [Sandaracinus amylolyticus]|uniref:Uncharacterized protein n=1 Tax=Sandaracinus amylolyticus TaxID=927083 RepID=A0A0F6W7U7_9BACT|nr:hypothetical protein DB32_006657 [Sandaracinus amylolyticus]
MAALRTIASGVTAVHEHVARARVRVTTWFDRARAPRSASLDA